MRLNKAFLYDDDYVFIDSVSGEASAELLMKWGHKTERVFRPYLQIHYEQNEFQQLVTRADRWMDTLDKAMASRYNMKN